MNKSKSESMLLKTSIPKLDELLNGGVKIKKSILFCSTPGVESLQFAQQILHHRLEQGDHGLYFVNNKKPEAIRYMLHNYGWDLSEFGKKGIFYFFDCYSGMLGIDSKEKFFVHNTTDLEEIDKELTKAMEKMENKNTILVFDALSSLIDLCGEKAIGYLRKLLKRASELRITPLFLFTQWPYDKNIIKKVRECFDCIIDLKAIERKVILRNYFFVTKASWLEKIKKQDIPFKVLCPGGVRVYIPKILVTGPYNSGKSSFVHSASTKAVSVDRIGTTIALDHGHVDYRGFAVDLWGTPGQERFDPILELLGGESLGVIIIIDSTNPKGFVRAKDMLEKSKTEGLPSIVVANKANLKGALKPKQIRKKMKLPKEVPIVPVIAADLKAIREGLKKKQPCKLKEEDIHNVLSKLFEIVV